MFANRAALPSPAKYLFLRALRPFSLSVVLVTCGLGIVLAWHDGQHHLLRAVLVMIAGILLQSSANLFNDHADLELWQQSDLAYAGNVIKMIHRNVLMAQVMTVVAIVIGLWLVSQSGWLLLVIGIVGLLGGYFYTGEPVAYKNTGGGVIAVFLFTGILMVLGSYVAITGTFSHVVVLYSIPVSMISSMLLLSNELRDLQDDAVNGINTFTVLFGAQVASRFYRGLGICAVLYGSTIGLLEGMRWPWLMLVPLLALIQPYRLLKRSRTTCQPALLVNLPPMTGRYFVVFGVCMMLAI